MTWATPTWGRALAGLGLCAALALSSAPPAAAQASSPAIQQLLDKVEYWKQHKRPDKVAEAWRKILSSDPDHAQALQELAVLEARAGRKEAARGYLERLERAHPGHPAVAQITRLVDLGPKYEALLTEARGLWKAGDKPAAIAAYRRAFGNQGPRGSLGVEFYTRLAGIDDAGWQEAREGLERLVAQNPGNPEYEFVLARHLTYRAATRRDGIARLAALAEDPKMGAKAREAWSNALEWLDAKRSDAKLFDDALDKLGKDPDLSKRLAELRRPEPTRPGKGSKNPRIAAAYKALDAGNLPRAEALFKEEQVRRPRSPLPPHGLAMVAMARREFEKARDLLEGVKKQSPGRSDLWKRPLAEVSFWLTLQQAEALRVAGKLRKAEKLLDEIVARHPRLRHHVDMALGNLYGTQGKQAEARLKFEAVLVADPEHVGALRALVDLAVAGGRFDEARALNERLGKVEASAAMEKSRLEAERLRSEATISRAEGRLEEARGLLDEARALAPESTWILHDLVYACLELRDVVAARGALAELLELDAATPEFQVARAVVLMEEDRVGEALAVIEAVPVDPTNVGLQNVRRQLEVRVRASRLARRATLSGSDEWRRELEALEREASGEPALVALVALAWSEAGEHDRALTLMQRAIARMAKPTPSILLVRGAILLRAGRDHELSDLLMTLDEGGLTDREKSDYAALRITLAARRADVAREAGDSPAAFAYLRPLLRTYPERPELLSALGRLFMHQGDHEQALALYQRLLRLAPEDFEAREGAVRAALALGRVALAERIRDQGLERSPGSPRMLLVAARMDLLQGDHAAAMDKLRRARAELDARDDGLTPSAAGDADVRLEVDSEYADVLVVAFREFGGGDGDAAEPSESQSLAAQIREEEARIEARYAPDVSIMPGIRYRGGVSGLGRLVEFQIPFSGSLTLGYFGRLRLTVTPSIATSGALDLTDPLEADRFGAIGVVTLSGTQTSTDQVHSGAAIEVAWEWDHLRLRLGSSPLGYPLMTFVGDARFGLDLGPFAFSAQVGRRVVRDSALSLAGMYEPVSGLPWGLVTANGGRLDLSFDFGDALVYLFGGYHYLMGTDVVDNQQGFGGGGLRWRVHDQRSLVVETGLLLGLNGYERNLRHFTVGHGGYFSPQIFVNAAVPMRVRGGAGRLRYAADVDVGLNWFEEELALYYPGSLDLQKARVGRLDSKGDPVESYYPGQSTLGFAGNLRAAVGYEIFEQLVLGARVRFHYAEDYVEVYGGAFLGYTFGDFGTPTYPEDPYWD